MCSAAPLGGRRRLGGDAVDRAGGAVTAAQRRVPCTSSGMRTAEDGRRVESAVEVARGGTSEAARPARLGSCRPLSEPALGQDERNDEHAGVLLRAQLHHHRRPVRLDRRCAAFTPPAAPLLPALCRESSSQQCCCGAQARGPRARPRGCPGTTASSSASPRRRRARSARPLRRQTSLSCRSSAETPAAWARRWPRTCTLTTSSGCTRCGPAAPQTAAAPPCLGLTVRALHRARSTSTPGRSRLSRRSPTTQARSAATGSRTARPRRSALPPRLTPPKPCP
eukprot:COSAG04_NODE_551_length_12696_cov_13.088989_2_plen_281_part_00